MEAADEPAMRLSSRRRFRVAGATPSVHCASGARFQVTKKDASHCTGTSMR